MKKMKLVHRIVLVLLNLSVVTIQTASGQELFYCASPDCKDPLSLGLTVLQYRKRTDKHLSFPAGQEIRILSKPVTDSGTEWVAWFSGKIGLIPKSMVREQKMFKYDYKYKVPFDSLPFWGPDKPAINEPAHSDYVDNPLNIQDDSEKSHVPVLEIPVKIEGLASDHSVNPVDSVDSNKSDSVSQDPDANIVDQPTAHPEITFPDPPAQVTPTPLASENHELLSDINNQDRLPSFEENQSDIASKNLDNLGPEPFELDNEMPGETPAVNEIQNPVPSKDEIPEQASSVNEVPEQAASLNKVPEQAVLDHEAVPSMNEVREQLELANVAPVESQTINVGLNQSGNTLPVNEIPDLKVLIDEVGELGKGDAQPVLSVPVSEPEPTIKAENTEQTMKIEVKSSTSEESVIASVNSSDEPEQSPDTLHLVEQPKPQVVSYMEESNETEEVESVPNQLLANTSDTVKEASNIPSSSGSSSVTESVLVPDHLEPKDEIKPVESQHSIPEIPVDQVKEEEVAGVDEATTESSIFGSLNSFIKGFDTETDTVKDVEKGDRLSYPDSETSTPQSEKVVVDKVEDKSKLDEDSVLPSLYIPSVDMHEVDQDDSATTHLPETENSIPELRENTIDQPTIQPTVLPTDVIADASVTEDYGAPSISGMNSHDDAAPVNKYENIQNANVGGVDPEIKLDELPESVNVNQVPESNNVIVAPTESASTTELPAITEVPASDPYSERRSEIHEPTNFEATTMSPDTHKTSPDFHFEATEKILEDVKNTPDYQKEGEASFPPAETVSSPDAVNIVEPSIMPLDTTPGSANNDLASEASSKSSNDEILPDNPEIPVVVPLEPEFGDQNEHKPMEGQTGYSDDNSHSHEHTYDHHDTHEHGHSHSHHHHSHSHTHKPKDKDDSDTMSIILVVKHLSSTLLSFLPEHLQDTILDVDDALVFTGIIALTLISICVPYFLMESILAVKPLKKQVVELNKNLWKVSAAYENQQEEFDAYKKKALAYDEDQKRIDQLEMELQILKELEGKHKSQVKMLQKQLKASGRAADGIEGLIEAAIREKEIAITERNSFKTSCTTLQATLNAKLEELEQAEANAGSLVLDLEVLTHEKENLSKRLSGLDIEHERLKAKLASECEVKRTKEAESEKLSLEMDKKDAEMTELRRILHQYEDNVSSLTEELTVKENELAALKETLGDDSPLIDISEAKARLKSAEEEASGLKSRVESVTLENQALSKQLEDIKSEFHKVKERKDDAENNLKVLEGWFKKKEDELRAAVAKLEVEQSIKHKDKDDLVKIIREKESEVQLLITTNEALKSEIEDMKAAHRNEVRTLEAKADENWLSLCQSERKTLESRKEAEQLRQKLVAIVKDKQMGDENDPYAANGDMGMYSLPPEMVPPPVPDDFAPPTYLPLDFDFIPPPPLGNEPMRPPPLGRISPNAPNYTYMDDEPLSPITRGNDGRGDFSGDSSRSNSPLDHRRPGSRDNWMNDNRSDHRASQRGRRGQGQSGTGPKTSSPIPQGLNL